MPSRAPDRRLAAALGVAFFWGFLLFQHGHFAGTDEVGVFETTRSLYERGSLEVPPGFHTFRSRDGRVYSHFAIGQSVAALPFFALGKLAAAVLPFRWRQALAGPRIEQGEIRWGGSVEIFATSLYAPVASALLVALFFLWQRRLGASPRAAVAAACLFGATTYAGMMSVYFLQHTTEAIAILGGLYLLHAFRRDGGLRPLALGSLVASLVLLIRVPATVAGPALAAYALFAVWARRRAGAGPRLAPALAALAAPAAAVLLVHVAVNRIKWGTWIASPFLAQSYAFGTPLHVGLAGFLLSPGCSIFVYTPLLLLLPWLLADFWRRRRAECLTCAAIALSFLLLCARFDLWTGLWSSPGPRYVFALTPLLLLPLGPWLDAHPGRAARAAVGGLAAAGLAVQLALVVVSWPAVIELMHYREWSPAKGFVWIASQSPVPGAVHALREGWVDLWLWRLASGWEGRPGWPGAALAFLLVWGAGMAAAVAWVVRALRSAAPRAAPAAVDSAVRARSR
jgi:hypothetical protein